MLWLLSVALAEEVPSKVLQPVLIPTRGAPEREVSSLWREDQPIPPFGELGDASAEVDDLEQVWNAAAEVDYDMGEAALVGVLLEKLPGTIEAVEAELWLRATSFEGASAALTLSGEMRLDLADLIYQAPPPAPPCTNCEVDPFGPDPLFDLVRPLHDSGIARLEAAMALAKEHGAWCSWQDRAQARLYEDDPRKWPAGHPEERGQAPIDVPKAGPLSE